jgi:hypothetical protein
MPLRVCPLPQQSSKFAFLNALNLLCLGFLIRFLGFSFFLIRFLQCRQVVHTQCCQRAKFRDHCKTLRQGAKFSQISRNFAAKFRAKF